MIPDLSALLCYQNRNVIAYFCHHHRQFTVQEAELLFTDLLGWLWLNHHRRLQDKRTYLFGPLLALDLMWHVFILHTQDYVAFSFHYFDAYFHHEVEPVGFEHVLDEDELRDYLQDCFRYLGEEWVARRFAEALH